MTMTEFVAPRIAEFPQGILQMGGWRAVSLSIAHEWLVHEFGEGELVKVKGLPLSTIASMYPEGEGVAFFSAVRGTTMLGELQEIVDAVARSITSEDSTFLHELGRVRRVHVPAEQLVGTIEARHLHSNIVWVAHEVLNADDSYMELYELAVFVCAPLLVEPEFRELYLSREPDWEPVFEALGLKDLWVIVSTRIDAWLLGDDDDD